MIVGQLSSSPSLQSVSSFPTPEAPFPQYPTYTLLHQRDRVESITYPKELAQGRVIRLAWLALDILLNGINLMIMLSLTAVPDLW